LAKPSAALSSRCAWWWGDALNFGEGKYGEMCEQALAATKLSYSHLRHAKAVAKCFELCRRRHNCSWSHHQEVAHIDDPSEQDRLLDEAEENGWSQKSFQNGGDGSYFGRMPPELVGNCSGGSWGGRHRV
jgi:hypothetical protein